MPNEPTPVRVLVVDDEPEIRRVLHALLTRSSQMSATVSDCPDGESAITLLAKEKFDIVISDYRMNQATGIDVLARAADLHPKSGRILMTGYSEIDIAVDAVNRGRVSGFVRKPWDSRQFLALIESLAADVQSRVASPLKVPAATPSPRPASTGPAAPAVDVAAPRHASGMSVRSPERELEEVERQMRQLRVKFGIGSLSAEGYKKIIDDLRQKRAQLELEIMTRSG